jgi:Ca2+-transporting ATPase
MATVVTVAKDKMRSHVKGASEIVLNMCTHQLNPQGQVIPLTSAEKKKLEGLIQSMAEGALRTICLAYRETSAGFLLLLFFFLLSSCLSCLSFSHYHKIVPTEGWDTFSSEKLTMIGIVGIQDPLRPEVPSAVKACQRAGVVVRMVTGDNLVTAKNIAINCGIFIDDGTMVAMEGPVFRELPEDQLDEILPRLRVLARSSPLDKQILVNKLKECGEIVAVTGDGTNDAPALKLAHVGFSMGISGTEVAKEASDIILMDDNFSSIVKALLWGRNVYDSIRKFLQFQLTVNIVRFSSFLTFCGHLLVFSSVFIPLLFFFFTFRLPFFWLSLVL